jgi:hypothetical protein
MYCSTCVVFAKEELVVTSTMLTREHILTRVLLPFDDNTHIDHTLAKMVGC